MITRPGARRGAVLIVVLGILVVLALLATTFATMQTVERSVARNYLDEVRARLLSESGIEAALAQLPRLVATEPFPDPARPITRSWVYYGGQLDEAATPQPQAPLETARNPSFALEDEATQDPSDPNTRPRQVTIEGRPCGVSGIPGGAYSRHGDQYSLRVRDLSGLLYVNDGLSLSGGNASSVSRNLARVLNRLGDVIGCRTLGDRIVASRPLAGYRTPMEIEPVLGTTDFRKARPFLTTVAWVDPNVANPVPLSAAHLKDYPVDYHRGDPPVYRRGRGVDAWGRKAEGELLAYDGSRPPDLSNAIYALDELSPQWIEIVPRAPVNVNTAPREVLIALLADLQGVFVGYRRRNNISPTVGGYLIPTIVHTYSPQGSVPPLAAQVPSEGDEYGFLHKTVPLRYLGGSTVAAGDAVSAAAVADEMLACREKRGPYATLPIGGPFRTWRQFNAFCDHLLRAGVLDDKRPMFYDYELSGPAVVKGGNITGYGPLVRSEYERRLASQALADVLKANFNPNLHLNEVNPDRNLHLLVDKTDLVVNSTEFIFTPSGHFEIESVGRVLRAKGGDDVFAAADNELVAMNKTAAAVKLFDVYRETNQAQFSRGAAAPSKGAVPTNGGGSVEVGPEPDNGPGPAENEWGGYVALASVGGLRAAKAPRETKRTPEEAPVWGETIGVHFQWDFDAHAHADKVRQELAQGRTAGEAVENFPDPGETYGGPYDPAHGEAGRHRLARSFRMPAPPAGSTGTNPRLWEFAPLDLRVDGGYVERHASPAWWISSVSFVPNTRDLAFVASFWIKPSYPPDRSGKPRLMWNAIRYSATPWVLFANDQGLQNWLGLFYNAGHEADAPDAVFPTEDMSVFGEIQWKDINSLYNGHVPIRPQAFLFARGYGPRTTGLATTIPRTVIYNSAVVNHAGHAHARETVFREHEWTHVALIAHPRSDEYYYGARAWFSMRTPAFNRMLINGREVPYTLEAFQNHNKGSAGPLSGDVDLDWSMHANGDRNSVRFGTPSTFARGYTPGRANFTADATVDEFFLWNVATGERHALGQWLLGRYHKPLDPGTSPETSEGTFTSAEISFRATRRLLPPPQRGTVTVSVPPSSVEILGMSWTVYGEDASDPRVLVTDAASRRGLEGRVALYLKTAAGLRGPFADDGYSATSVTLPEGEPFRYLARFELAGLADTSILLATPVLDDVTIFYRAGEEPGFAYYVSVRTAREGL